MFTIQIDNVKYDLNEPKTIEEIIDNKNLCYLAANVNNRLRELTFVIDHECTINLLELTSTEAARIYEASLRFILAMAFEKLYPQAKIEFTYSISRSIMCTFSGLRDNIQEVTDALNAEMKRIIAADYPINRAKMTVKEVKKIYQQKHNQEKIDILEYRPDQNVNLYSCDGYVNYMFCYMVPSTKYLSKYLLVPYHPGVVLQYPRADAQGEIPNFEDAPRFNQTLHDAYEWTKVCGGGYIATINHHMTKKTTIDFINMCETKHNNMLSEVGAIIDSRRQNVQLIAIAGPSSSGKTTFSLRLRIELMIRGFDPITISIDDYYLPREEVPLDENGKSDFEHINAIDVKQFNQDMLSLIQGKKVTLPKFSFKTGKREEGKTVQMKPNQVIIIEGIHALNDILTSSIPRYKKFKIYIGPFPQMHIDNHNPINITDLRLIRRLVRDWNFRNTDVKRTFDMWPSVRRGEFKWIYPNQEDADFVYNSELAYEFCVLKKYALPILEKVKRDDPYFIQANRLVKFLKYFIEIDEKWVPCNSLLREFIGGSCFHIE